MYPLKWNTLMASAFRKHGFSSTKRYLRIIKDRFSSILFWKLAVDFLESFHELLYLMQLFFTVKLWVTRYETCDNLAKCATLIEPFYYPQNVLVRCRSVVNWRVLFAFLSFVTRILDLDKAVHYWLWWCRSPRRKDVQLNNTTFYQRGKRKLDNF